MAEKQSYEKFIKSQYNRLVDDMRPDEIIGIMFEKGYISRREKSNILSIQPAYARTEKLLDIIRGEEAHQCLYDAFEKTSQCHLQSGFSQKRKYFISERVLFLSQNWVLLRKSLLFDGEN